MAKTPPHLRAFNIPEICPSRKLSRAVLSYAGEDKKEFISVAWIMEHKHALAQIGDSIRNVDRVSQLEMASCLSISRSTFTKRSMKFSAPDSCPRCGSQRVKILSVSITTRAPGELQCENLSCRHRFTARWDDERRLKQSRIMKKISATHPRWSRRKKREEARRQIRRTRKYLGCIFARNAGFGEANSYAMPEAARPEILKGGRPDDPRFEAAALANQFGDELFDRDAHIKLRYKTLNGFRKSYGWIWHPNLPDARSCVCRLGQSKLEFQGICPKCNGAGFVVSSAALGGSSMPANGRIILHWLLDRGIDEEVRNDSGEITKHRGILEEYTQADIGRALGLNVSTVRRYFRAFRWLNLVRTIPGRVTKDLHGTVVHREPHKILWLPSRTMDEDIARAERDRMDALLSWNRRFLEKRQLEALEQAVELAKRVLGEWEGQEHRLEAFWNEMRRRLAANQDHARLVNVLFPLQRE
jgi:hypothetical protein